MAEKWKQEDLAAIAIKVRARASRLSFEEFCKEFWETIPGTEPVIWNWHMTVMCQEMQKVAERVFQAKPAKNDLLINISPGSSKSSICSVLFHPWTWTRMPNARHINSSHTEALVHDLANKSREVIKSAKYKLFFPEIDIRSDQDAKGYYVNNHGGFRLAATVGGKSPLGFHGHFLSGDDLIDPEKVLSDVEREVAKNFISNGLPSRMTDKRISVVILIMQRLGRGDPTEVVLDIAKREGSRKVRHICIPAELTEKVQPAELAENYVNGLMDPVRLPKEVLVQNEVKDPLRYAAQFLQDPRAMGGGLFKEIYFNKRVPASPYGSNRIRYWDRACLLGNSLIETETDLVSIKDVKEGDRVLTREGYKKVLKSHKTKEIDQGLLVILSNGSVLCLTPDHPVWTNTRGWVEAERLRSDDRLVFYGDSQCISSQMATQLPRRLDLQEFLTKEEYISLVSTIRSTSEKKKLRENNTPRKSSCPESYGKSIREVFPVDMRLVTKTETQLTLESRTCKLHRKGAATLVSSKWLARNRMISEFTEEIINSHPGGRSQFYSKLSSYRVNLKLSLIHALTQITSDIKQTRSIPVYDLTVENTPEFFANGVLVHNSTADGGCYTAGVLMSRDSNGSFYVEDVVRGQWEPLERNERMKATAYKDRARYGPNHEPVIFVESEGGSSGRDAWLGIVRALAGFNIKEDSVVGMGSKDTRAELWSAQLAAGNVFIVDGDWNAAYIDEHCLFKPEPGRRLGKYKDQVDSSSRACALLSQKAAVTPVFKTFKVGVRKPGLRIIVCSKDALPTVMIEDKPTLLVYFTNPVPKAEDKVIIPEHSLGKLLDAVVIRFADLDPADYQDKWEETIPEYQDVPANLVLDRDRGKQLWNFLLKQRPDNPGVIVLCDDGHADTRAYSVACGLCESLRLPKESTIYIYSTATNRQDKNPEPSNKHIYSMVRKTREMVVG